MPLPIGHATIGFTIHGLCSENESGFFRWKALLGILIFSNLPDIDVVLGIVFHGNGSVFHRGPTHSLIFALIGGFLASRVWKLWSQLPRFSFRICFLLILSHIVADFVFTSSPISFCWPITVSWIDGYSGLRDVVNLVLFGNYQDAKIIIGCAFLIVLRRTLLGFRLLENGQKLKSIFRL
jgi:membrane-bound metal-dependent hydrolase YbcI (DUF457 family)